MVFFYLYLLSHLTSPEKTLSSLIQFKVKCIWVVCLYMCLHHTVSDALVLQGLEMVVSHRVSAEHHLVVWRVSPCSAAEPSLQPPNEPTSKE